MATWAFGEFHAADFNIQKCVRYHGYRERFYEMIDNAILISSLITGSGMAVRVAYLGTAGAGLTVAFGAVVALATVLRAVFKFSKSVEKHQALRARYSDLGAKIQTWPTDEKHLARCYAARRKIEKDEPTERRLIEILAYADEARARGAHPRYYAPLSWAQRHFGHFGTFGMERLYEWRKQLAVQEAGMEEPTSRSNGYIPTLAISGSSDTPVAAVRNSIILEPADPISS
jgi:hypothetical protein